MRSLHARMLVYLDEVARAGSIRKAAAKLNVAASSINRQILALEADAGVELFERLPQRLKPTLAGDAVIAHVRQTLQEFERCRAHVEELRGTRRGEVSIAIQGGIGTDLLAHSVMAFREQRPQVKLLFHRFGLPELLQSLRDGRADLGLAFGIPDAADLRVLRELHCPIGAVVSPRHALADRPSVTLTDLIAHRLVLPAHTMSMRVIIDRVLQRADLAATPFVEANEVEFIKRLVVLDDTVAFLNRLNIEPELRRGEILFKPIEAPDIPVQTLRLVQLEQRVPSPLAMLFADTLLGLADNIVSTHPHAARPDTTAHKPNPEHP